jgi:hypothetical protein
MLLFSINRSRGYENPSLDIIVIERCSTGGCPLEEACEHCYLIQSVISVAISYIISVYCEDYAGYFTVILSFLAFHFYSAYFIYLVSCTKAICEVFIAENFKGGNLLWCINEVITYVLLLTCCYSCVSWLIIILF